MDVAQDEDTHIPVLADLLEATARASKLELPDFSSSYLDHLVSLPLDDLLREPSLISNESSTIESELVNLCFREYSTFTSVHRCSAAVQSAFDDFDVSLTRLLDSVPALEAECRTFTSATSPIQQARAKATLVQEHQDKLLELLEIPRLMDACVRNGYYQEAMELASHTELLATRYGVALVQDVAEEVGDVVQVMLAQLLALLREPVKLPTLVKAVSFLRRLGTMTESELGLVFLASRLYNFRSQLEHIERDRIEPVRYVRKYVDLFREHVYDIISQFSAIFEASAQLVSFASQCVGDLVHLVSSYVPRVASDSASLSSILVQLAYCAQSFARVGLDFSALVGEPFTDSVLAIYAQAVSTTTLDLSKTLRDTAKSAADPATLFAQGSSVQQFPPLALFMNGHLSALNSLRLLAPMEIYPNVTRVQSDSLTAATQAVLQFVQQSGAADTPASPRARLIRRNTETQLTPEGRIARKRESKRVLVALADAWIDVVVPTLVNGLRGGVYEAKADPVDAMVAELRAWADANREKRNDIDEAIEELATAVNGQSEAPARLVLINGLDADADTSKPIDSDHVAATTALSEAGASDRHPSALATMDSDSAIPTADSTSLTYEDETSSTAIDHPAAEPHDAAASSPDLNIVVTMTASDADATSTVAVPDQPASNHGEDEFRPTSAGGSEQDTTFEPGFTTPKNLESQPSVLEPVPPSDTSEKLEAGLEPSGLGGPVEHVAPEAVETVFLPPVNLETETDITEKLQAFPETSPPSGPMEHVAPEAVESILLPSANPKTETVGGAEATEDTPSATANNSEQDVPSAEASAATKSKKKKKKKSKK